jgi:mitogen-activated protein kinase 1/3
LINQNGDLKICDFGMGRGGTSLHLKMTSCEDVTTSYYRAPEGILHRDLYTQSVDVWAAGCILAELMLRRPLFPGRNSTIFLSFFLSFSFTQAHSIWFLKGKELLEMIVEILGTPSPEELEKFPLSGVCLIEIE